MARPRMSIIERIMEEAKSLPEKQAREVLDFIAALKRTSSDQPDTDDRAERDWAEFERHAGAWSGPFERAECYDRPRIR